MAQSDEHNGQFAQRFCIIIKSFEDTVGLEQSACGVFNPAYDDTVGLEQCACGVFNKAYDDAVGLASMCGSTPIIAYVITVGLISMRYIIFIIECDDTVGHSCGGC